MGFVGVALMGDMDRLERHYINETRQFGVELNVFTKEPLAKV